MQGLGKKASSVMPVMAFVCDFHLLSEAIHRKARSMNILVLKPENSPSMKSLINGLKIDQLVVYADGYDSSAHINKAVTIWDEVKRDSPATKLQLVHPAHADKVVLSKLKERLPGGRSQPLHNPELLLEELFPEIRSRANHVVSPTKRPAINYRRLTLPQNH